MENSEHENKKEGFLFTITKKINQRMAGEDNKYFVPSIEDIRVGYEYEYHSCHPQEEGNCTWNTKKFPDPFVGYNLKAFETQINRGWIRVPYLTKEQIEAEGWELANVLVEDDNGNDMFNTGFVKYIDEDHWYELVLKEDNRTFIQYKWYRNSVAQLCREIYYGKCPSINEFRFITKLLGISK